MMNALVLFSRKSTNDIQESSSRWYKMLGWGQGLVQNNLILF